MSGRSPETEHDISHKEISLTPEARNLSIALIFRDKGPNPNRKNKKRDPDKGSNKGSRRKGRGGGMRG